MDDNTTMESMPVSSGIRRDNHVRLGGSASFGTLLMAAITLGGIPVSNSVPDWERPPPGPLPIPPERKAEIEAETIAKAAAKREKKAQRKAFDKMRTRLQQGRDTTQEQLDIGYDQFHKKLAKDYKEMTGVDWD